MKKALVVSLALLATQAMATGVVAEGITLESAVAAGSGCPAGSIEARLSDDKRTLELDFSRFAAEAGPGITLSESRKNCAVLVDIRYPKGLSYAVKGLKVRGRTSLQAGATAVVTEKFHFQGQAATGTVSKTLEGPYAGSFGLTEALEEEELVFSPCDLQRALTVNVSARVESEQARSTVAVGKLPDGSSTRLELGWRECPAPVTPVEPVIEPGA